MENRHQDWDVEIPREVYEGEEKKLKRRVIHFQKGIRRIFVFTIVGFIMGWFSYLCEDAEIFFLKVILGIPYKINELIHNAIHGSHYDSWFDMNAFFQNSWFLSIFAGRFISVLFGGMIYGSLAYFTGDRKVFTYRRYAKFFGIWVSVITVTIGSTFVINDSIRAKNETLQNVTGFQVYSDMRGDSCRIGNNAEKDVNQALGNYLKKALYLEGEKLEELDASVRDKNGEQILGFWFGKLRGRYMKGRINTEKRYIVTEQGKVYRATEAFVNIVEKFDREEGYERYYRRYDEQGEMITYEEMAD